jgi:hypothetical protein
MNDSTMDRNCMHAQVSSLPPTLLVIAAV